MNREIAAGIGFVMNREIAAGIGFVVVLVISHLVGDFTRIAIWRRASKIMPDATFSDAKLHHSIIRIRDDIASML
jgi:hypothetical protein